MTAGHNALRGSGPGSAVRALDSEAANLRGDKLGGAYWLFSTSDAVLKCASYGRDTNLVSNSALALIHTKAFVPLAWHGRQQYS